jgi:hypothetical protein
MRGLKRIVRAGVGCRPDGRGASGGAALGGAWRVGGGAASVGRAGFLVIGVGASGPTSVGGVGPVGCVVGMAACRRAGAGGAVVTHGVAPGSGGGCGGLATDSGGSGAFLETAAEAGRAVVTAGKRGTRVGVGRGPSMGLRVGEGIAFRRAIVRACSRAARAFSPMGAGGGATWRGTSAAGAGRGPTTGGSSNLARDGDGARLFDKLRMRSFSKLRTRTGRAMRRVSPGDTAGATLSPRRSSAGGVTGRAK